MAIFQLNLHFRFFDNFYNPSTSSAFPSDMMKWWARGGFKFVSQVNIPYLVVLLDLVKGNIEILEYQSRCFLRKNISLWTSDRS